MPVKDFSKIKNIITAVSDWLNNLNAEPVSIAELPEDVKIHSGFLESVNHLWEEGFADNIIKLLDNPKHNHKKILITGYSKGAALARSAATLLHSKANIPADKFVIRMFEPPRPGNLEYKKYFEDTFKDAKRFEYQDDIVPHLPPVKAVSDKLRLVPVLGNLLERKYSIEEWNYNSVGTLNFIDWDKKLREVDEDEVFQKRLEKLEKIFIGLTKNDNDKEEDEEEKEEEELSGREKRKQRRGTKKENKKLQKAKRKAIRKKLIYDHIPYGKIYPFFMDGKEWAQKDRIKDENKELEDAIKNIEKK